MIFDPLWLILMAPVALFALWASWRTHAAYKTFSAVSARSGVTGAEIARRLLDADRLREVAVEAVGGQLTDHYDPRDRTLRLSEGVYASRSIAALGIAAHETGHALQHADAYKPLTFRQAFFPVAAFSSKAWVWLLMGSFFLGRTSPELGSSLVLGAAALAAVYAVFAIVTLPVEFNASRRALLMLESTRVLDAEELVGAKKVLDAAALTYVASAAQAVMTVIYLLARSRDR
jgi:uncharacterized protein